jgi:hypothetical protein
MCRLSRSLWPLRLKRLRRLPRLLPWKRLPRSQKFRSQRLPQRSQRKAK